MDASVHPAATETAADGIDSDCDGAELCYTDYDGDGFRPDEYSEVEGDLLCTGAGLVGAAAPAGDCDDTDASVNPDGEEAPSDGVDQNCDGTEQCYIDADNDGFRTMDGALVDSTALHCDEEGVANMDAPATDCDDAQAEVNPDARDLIGDEVDSDCDGVEYCYADLDGDGYRTSEVIESEDIDCEDEGEASVGEPLVDCDDSTSGVYPGAEEIPDDGVDQDCDGTDTKTPAVAADDTASPTTPATPDAGDGGSETPIEVIVEPDKSGCSTTRSTPSGLAWLFSLGLIFGFRRRS
jgi:MYXO-CTERM domain-containing protein